MANWTGNGGRWEADPPAGTAEVRLQWGGDVQQWRHVFADFATAWERADTDDDRKQAKLGLPALVLAWMRARWLPPAEGNATGRWQHRGQDCITHHSGLVQLDLDGIDRVGLDIDGIAEDVGALPFVRLAWVSPSGSGVKALVAVEPPLDRAGQGRLAHAIISQLRGAGLPDSCFEPTTLADPAKALYLYPVGSERVHGAVSRTERIALPPAPLTGPTLAETLNGDLEGDDPGDLLPTLARLDLGDRNGVCLPVMAACKGRACPSRRFTLPAATPAAIRRAGGHLPEGEGPGRVRVSRAACGSAADSPPRRMTCGAEPPEELVTGDEWAHEAIRGTLPSPGG